MLFLYKIPTPPPLPWVQGRWSSLYPVGVVPFFNSSISAVCTKPSFSHTKHIKIVINNVIFDKGCLVFSTLTVQKTDFGRLAWVDSRSHSTWYRGQYPWGWHMLSVQVRLVIVPEITAIMYGDIWISWYIVKWVWSFSGFQIECSNSDFLTVRAIGKSIDFCMFKSSNREYWINFVAQWGSSASWISGFSGLFMTTRGTLLMPSWSVPWSVLPGCLWEWALTLDSQ